MKKLLNKLSNSGNLRDESFPEEHLEIHYRKSTTLPSDAKDTSADFKMKKSFSLSKASSPRYKEAMESQQQEDFSKKKSSSIGVRKEKVRPSLDKLNESDDKLVRKSKSMKSPTSMRSPSLKSIFSNYEPQKDGKNVIVESSDSEDEDAFVPHQHPDVHDDEHFNMTAPIRVPSAPARMAHSPTSSTSPSHSFSPSPSPVLVSLNARAASPVPVTPTSAGKRTPPFSSSSPTAQVPAFTSAPPTNALVPTPHVIVADEFDIAFSNRHNDSFINNNDDFGSPFKSVFGAPGHVQLDSDKYEEPNDAMETDEIMRHKKSGIFSFGSNKPMKLKA
jgi:hypothetical protein